MVDKINRAIEELWWIPSARDVAKGHRQLVCHTTLADWNEFVESENQALRSKYMEWIDGSVFLVEFASRVRRAVALEVERAVYDDPVAGQYLFPLGGIFSDAPGLPRYESNGSLRPSRVELQRLGVSLPTGLASWIGFATLRVEIGVTRGWGHTHSGSLDWKALHAWTRVPGVAYVLCISVDETLDHAEYKCYELSGGTNAPAFPLNANAIRAPHTVLLLDARRLLGIPLGFALPPLFPDPFQVDLYAVVQAARRDRCG